MKFLVTNLQDCTGVIEQEIESVPELSLMTILFLFAAGTLAALTLARKRLGHLL